jgi:polar amino acid transport system substrate-binding protein
MRLVLLALAVALSVSLPARAQEQPSKLRVGVAGSAPFVVKKGESVDGIAVQVWQQLATRSGLKFELHPQPNVATALAKVAAGELDVAIGPISITAERAEKVTFTQPYYHSSLAIAAPSSEKTTWQKLKPFFSRPFLVGIATLLAILCIVGFLVWVVEHRRNPDQFPRHPVRGVGNGIWLALVTMTTVGYGDRAPVTVPGRVIVGVWMLIALIAASSLTAGIASVLTVSQLESGSIERAEQLTGIRVAVVGGTTGERFARQHGARTVPAPDLPAAVELVTKKEAAAVVFDRPQLRYHLLNHPDAAMSLSTHVYEPQGYGFATQQGNTPLAHQLIVALLATMESGTVVAVARDWLGDE